MRAKLVLLASISCFCACPAEQPAGLDAGLVAPGPDAARNAGPDAAFVCVRSEPDAGKAIALSVLSVYCDRVGQGEANYTLQLMTLCGEPYAKEDWAHLSGAVGTMPPSCTEGQFAEQMQRFEHSIALGRMSYDPNRAAACVAAGLDGGSPLVDGGLIEPCAHALSGSVRVGGACASGEECVDLAYCRRGPQGTCSGTCVTVLARGVSCDPDEDFCAPGTRCRADTVAGPWSCRPPAQPGEVAQTDSDCDSGLLFVDGHCLSPAALGEVCGENAPCDISAICVKATSADPTGICRAPALEGESCGDGAPSCELCLTCDAATNKCARRGTVGSACSAGLPCVAGAFCTAESKCARRARLGEACVTGAQSPAPLGSCMWSDTYCRRSAAQPASGTCAALPRLCEPCGDGPDLSASCAEGVCDRVHGACVPKPAEGEPCLDSYSCAPGLYCEPKKAGDATTKCAPLPGPGEKCSPTHTCSVAAYCDPTGDSCVAKLANGSPCENTDWCTSGYCSPHGHLCEEACLATPAGGCAGGYRDLYAFYLFFAGLVVVGRRRGKR